MFYLINGLILISIILYKIYSRGTVTDNIKEKMKPFIKDALIKNGYQNWLISDIRNIENIKLSDGTLIISVDTFIVNPDKSLINIPEVFINIKGSILNNGEYVISKINSVDVHDLMPEVSSFGTGLPRKIREYFTGHLKIPKGTIDPKMQNCMYGTNNTSYLCKNTQKMNWKINSDSKNFINNDIQGTNHKNSIRYKEGGKGYICETLHPRSSEFGIDRSSQQLRCRPNYESVNNNHFAF